MDPEQETVFSSKNEKKHVVSLAAIFVVLVLGIIFYWLGSFGIDKITTNNSVNSVTNVPVEVDTSDQVRTAEASEAGNCMLKKCAMDSGGIITEVDNDTVTYLEQYLNEEPVRSDEERLLDLSKVAEVDYFDKTEMRYLDKGDVQVGDFVQIIKEGDAVMLLTVIKN